MRIGMSAFEFYLRKGRRQLSEPAEVEAKFNPWHDPDDGRFTFANQGRYFGRGQSRSSDASTAGGRVSGERRARAATAQLTTRPTTSRPTSVTNAGANPPARPLRPKTPRQLGSSRSSVRSSSGLLKASATKLKPHESRLIDIGGIKVVQFGSGVELVPVAVASVEEFSAATAQGSALFDLDAVITGPQFELIQGSRGLIGQAVVNGRIIGNSAPDRYFMATIKGPDGIDRLTFGKGDPPPKSVATGFGGAVPLIINGKAVPGYEKAWKRYAESQGTGKNIVAYDSKRNVTALFIQPHGASGYSLQRLRSFIKEAGYDYAVLFDGSGSTSLRYKGKAIVNPMIHRELLIPLAIGFRMKRR